MIKTLIATLISLSALVFSQPVKADSDLSYKYVYQSIATSDDFKNKETREYVLKWLKQDKSHPYKVAISYCRDKRSGFSESQILRSSGRRLAERQSRAGWSSSRVDAYIQIEVAAISAGLQYYCPEFRQSAKELLEDLRKPTNEDG